MVLQTELRHASCSAAITAGVIRSPLGWLSTVFQQLRYTAATLTLALQSAHDVGVRQHSDGIEQAAEAEDASPEIQAKNWVSVRTALKFGCA